MSINSARLNFNKFTPTECKHEHYLCDYFSELPGVLRGAPGHHVCADCGSLAEEKADGTFVVYLLSSDEDTPGNCK